MSKLPKKQVIQLNADETIQDRIQLHYGNTLIRANTGAGKTTFVLKSLMRDHNVVLCCPTIAQVKQCEEDYGHQANIHFIHGEKSIPKCQRHFKIDPFYLKNGEVKLTPLISY